MTGSDFDLASYLAQKRATVEAGFASYVGTRLGAAPRELVEAVRYSLETPGKRLRPILVLAACEIVGGRESDAIGAALAIEMVHTYSLIHDDLPCMDDDDLRRGRPTSHKVFGEALAILAGDGLITEAFSLLATPVANPRVDAETVLSVVRDVATAAGVAGMVGGQVTDMVNQGRAVDQAALEHMHAMKTGALIEVAARVGARLGGGSPDEVEVLAAYGRMLGLAFQIADDVLDVTASTAVLGKRSAKDGARGKTTFPALLGVEGSRRRARELCDAASAAVGRFGAAAAPLVALARFVVERER
ncbi:MAG: farnesyl diphosphate synthase [bacterium]